MPTFDFHCNACNATFEKTLTFGSKGKPTCPTCKSKKTEKLISMPGIAFKGSGFYKTDSQKKTITPASVEKKEEKTQDTKTERENSEPKKPNPPNSPNKPNPPNQPNPPHPPNKSTTPS